MQIKIISVEIKNNNYDNKISEKIQLAPINFFLEGKGLNKLDRPRNRAICIFSDKCPTLMKSKEKKPTDAIVFKIGNIYRYPTRKECELMQNLPVGYTNKISYRLATGVIGNGWTVDVIAHIFKNMISSNIEVQDTDVLF